MEERAIDPSTKYKQYSIGTPWRWDPYTEQEQNPICYYIPVGDGLYRPTMDIRIFANAACSLIEKFGNKHYGEQARTLTHAGFQFFDICLATKMRLKDFLMIYESTNDNLPPYVIQKWKVVFGEHCAWHPAQVRLERAKQTEINSIFAEQQKENTDNPLQTRFVFRHDYYHNPQKNWRPLQPKTAEWLSERYFSTETSNVLHSIIRENTDDPVQFKLPKYSKYLLCYTKNVMHGRPRCSVNFDQFKTWIAYIFKHAYNEQPINNEMFIALLNYAEIPIKPIANAIGLEQAFSNKKMRCLFIESINKSLGYTFIKPINRYTGRKKKIK